MMIDRLATADVESALERQAAVALLGPRQVGKTTLALAVGKRRDALYLDLENSDDRAKLHEPGLFLNSFRDRLVILDEIHRAPDLFETLRGVIDTGRRSNRGIGRFLLLGSASMDLLRQSGESLAGRIAYVELNTLNELEVGSNADERRRLWLRGGFPASFLARADQDSFQLRKDFIRAYLERDVPAFGPRIPAATLERLWTMLAHNQGTLLNASSLARALEASSQSVSRYVDLLTDMLLLRRLPPYHANVGKRLVKSPKTYVRDSGLLHALLQIQSAESLEGHPVVGRSWEGHVIETLLSVAPWRTSAFFYRTAAGAEIDLVIEQPDLSLWAIEIKRSPSAKVSRGFHHAREDLRPAKTFVVHAGENRYPFAEGIEAIGVQELAMELQNLNEHPG